MNILIICNCAGGLNLFRGKLITELIARGHQVSAVIPLSNEESERLAAELLERLGCSTIPVQMERRGMNPAHDLQLLLAYKRVIKQLKPDLVITYTIKPNAYGGLVCRWLRVPYAANITGLGTAFQETGFLRSFVTVLYKYALKEAKVVFFENEDNCRTLISSGAVSEERSCILPGAGVDLERFFYQPYPADDGTVRFLFMGRIMKEKGVDELFAAMRRLRAEGKSCALDVLGFCEENYTDTITNYEKEGWLNYYGQQSDVRPFIARCHCFVLPSWHEGMANTNLECAASGRPIITSDIPGCREAVLDGISGLLCEARDAEKLYYTMEKMLSLPVEQRAEMGRAGRRYMEGTFDKKAVVEKTIKILGIDENHA